jgi:hypothetical protein
VCTKLILTRAVGYKKLNINSWQILWRNFNESFHQDFSSTLVRPVLSASGRAEIKLGFRQRLSALAKLKDVLPAVRPTL